MGEDSVVKLDGSRVRCVICRKQVEWELVDTSLMEGDELDGDVVCYDCINDHMIQTDYFDA